MSAIITTKLTIDNRIERNGKSVHNTNHTYRKQSILMIIFGAFFFYISYQKGNLPIALLVFQSYLSIMVITSFMMEYSRLLFSSNENSILERFPVNNRTVLCARIISMLYYLYLITFSLAVVPFFMLLFKEGFIVAILFLFAVIMNTLFSLLLANLFYIGLIRFLSAEKFQQIITYVQASLIVIVAFSYQFIAQLAKTEIDLLDHPGIWLFLTPPAYFMSIPLLDPLPGIYTFSLAGLGILLTLMLFILTMTGFSQSYIQNASALDKIYAKKSSKHNERNLRFLSRIFCRDTFQQAGFMLTWRMSRDNLKFKQGIIPMVIYALFFNAIPIYQLYKNSEEISLSTLLFPLYMLPLICITVIMTLNFSNDSTSLLPIYQSRPIKSPGSILLGSFKAVYIKYFLPFLSVIYLIYSIFIPWTMWIDLGLIFSFSTLFISLSYRFSNTVFPFSKEKSSFESGKIILTTLLTILVLSAMGGLHLLLSKVNWGIPIAIVVCCFAIYWCCRSISAIPMQKIELHY